jgi:FKBP-type peptidyl-prolyl cis-trans isomerase FkpA
MRFCSGNTQTFSNTHIHFRTPPNQQPQIFKTRIKQMKKHFSNFLIPALIVFILTGCLKSEQQYQQSCDYDPCSFKAPATEIAAVQHYMDSVGVTGTTQHCSGLFYKIENPGTGKTPEACSGVNVKYKGRFTNGQVFDSSNTGIDISLADVIRGWVNGVPLVKEGGKIALYIPPSLGYGPNNYRSIPGNSILVFDVELVKVY